MFTQNSAHLKGARWLNSWTTGQQLPPLSN